MIWPLVSDSEVKVILKNFLEETGAFEKRRLLKRHILPHLVRKISLYLSVSCWRGAGTPLMVLWVTDCLCQVEAAPGWCGSGILSKSQPSGFQK